MAEVDTQEKAQPDTGALRVGDFAAQASQKVQLDIDDAPFLMSFDEPPPPAVRDESLPEVAPPAEDELLRKKRKKMLMLGGGMVCLLLVVAVAVWYFWFLPPPAPPDTAEPTIIVVPSQKSVSGPMEYKIEFAPFMVEQREAGSVHFLQAKFTGVTQSEAVVAEAKKKELIVRDAVYYYLRNKKHEYLIDSANAASIKLDLLDIVNGMLNNGKMEDILLVNYILK